MKGVVLYSPHEPGNAAAATVIATRLSIPQTAVYDAFDGGAGSLLKDVLGIQSFPALVPVLDHLQGPLMVDATRCGGLVAEMVDIENREVHGIPGTPMMAARLNDTRIQGQQDIKGLVSTTTDLATLKTKLGL